LREKLQDAEVIYQPAARIALIGEGMRGVPGFLGRVATALGANGVNIISPSQSATERSMIFAIAENDLEKATHALHTEFVEKLV
jgi:aspartokinase